MEIDRENENIVLVSDLCDVLDYTKIIEAKGDFKDDFSKINKGEVIDITENTALVQRRVLKDIKKIHDITNSNDYYVTLFKIDVKYLEPYIRLKAFN